MGVFNIIWGSVPIVFVLAMYFNCRYMIKGNKNILIGVTIPFLELKNEKVLDITNKFKRENIILYIIAIIAFIPSFFFKFNFFPILQNSFYIVSFVIAKDMRMTEN